jgi:hypothetical protein
VDDVMSDQVPTIETDRCPIVSCGSRNIHRHTAFSPLARKVAEAWGNRNVCPIDQCKTCGAIWEPWPDNTSIDDVERAPCDNCAYRAGSAESCDPKQWQELQNLAKTAANWSFELGTTPTFFQCHKGVPIHIDREAGTIEFDFKAAGRQPLEHSCTGFLKMMWAYQGKAKREDLNT